ncbi:ABC transporter permease [Candidatus Bathyarchaeota archaeon]|nr:ABC transporter permease [Candidatus Bathyarchaeota archaeon]
MSNLIPLVEKEVKDLLRDPRIYIGLIIPVIIMPIIGFAMSAAMESSIKTAVGRSVKVAVLDLDRTQTSIGFMRFANASGLNVFEVKSDTVEKALEKLSNYDVKILLVIPEGFESKLNSLERSRLELYFEVKSVGFGEMSVFSAVENVMELYSKTLSNTIISSIKPGVNPTVVRNPLNVTSYTIVKGRVLNVPPRAIFGQLFVGYGIMVPTVLMVVSIMVAQIAATATAVENEEKTLETLLTLPVSRYEILMAKVIGSTLVAILGTLFSVLGFALYFQTLFPIQELPGEAHTIGAAGLPTPSPEIYLALCLSLLIAIFFTTSLGVIVGALSSDVRISNSLIGTVIVPIMIPTFLIMYGDVGSLPLALQVLVYALPVSYPMLIAKNMILSELPSEAVYGIPYSAGLTLLLLLLTSKLLVPEKLLLLQHKILMRRMRRKGQVSET